MKRSLIPDEEEDDYYVVAMKRARQAKKFAQKIALSDKSIPFWHEEMTNSDGTTEVILHLRQAVPLSRAKEVRVSINETNVSLPLFDDSQWDHVCIMEGFYEFLASESIQLHLNDYGNGVRKVYLRIKKDGKTLYANAHAKKLQDAVGGERVKLLKWFPPDLNPKELGMKIDPRIVPQRTPFWYGIRGEVTGSKAYKLMGFFVPRIGTFDFFKSEEVIDSDQRARMDLGSESEDYGVIAYLLHYPERKFEEIGYAHLPKGHPSSWGASPDGIIHDTRSESLGCIEFKTSTSKRTFDAYFYPQVYFEMIAMQVEWCDVVRILRHPTNPMQMILYVYRIHRDAQFEQELLHLISYAYRNADRLQKIVHGEARFIEKRKQMEEMAGREAPVDVIELTDEIREAFKKL